MRTPTYVCPVFTATEIPISRTAAPASHSVFICSQGECCQLSAANPVLRLLSSDTRKHGNLLELNPKK